MHRRNRRSQAVSPISQGSLHPLQKNNYCIASSVPALVLNSLFFLLSVVCLSSKLMHPTGYTNHAHSGECLTLSNNSNYSYSMNVLPLGPSDVGVDLLVVRCHLMSLCPKPCSTFAQLQHDDLW